MHRNHGQREDELDIGEAEALLKKHYGHGFVGLEETIKEGIAPAASEL